jgi:hypothetical protein
MWPFRSKREPINELTVSPLIQRAERLEVKEGDVVVLNIPQTHISEDQLAKLRTQLKEALPGGVKAIILPQGYQFSVIAGPASKGAD